jgi:succinyl-diaminopimelate desuccinylase
MDYIKILKDLIAIDTTVPPGNNYERVVDYLEPLFRQAGLETRKIEIPPAEAEGREGRVNLLCRRPAENRPRLVFYGHMDVVPAHGWEAFTPRVEGGKIFGRGAADMKGAIPALLTALERSKNTDLKYDISVIITTDEEVSQASQLRYLKQFLPPLKGGFVFDLDSSFGYVSIANLGALHLDIRVKGRSVHSGLSHLGENAVENAIPLMNALLKLKRRVTRRKSKVPACPDAGLERMVPRLNINMIHGGLKVNIVPDECIVTVDRRLIPEENMNEARQEILDTLKTVPEVKWEVASEISIPAQVPCKDPITDKLEKILKDVTGKGGKYGEMGSGDLTNIVVNEWHGEGFGLGVIRPDNNIHGNHEFVYQKDIEDLSEIIYRFITSP